MEKVPNNWVMQLNDLDTIPENMVFDAAHSWSKIEVNIVPSKNNSRKYFWSVAACIICMPIVWFAVKNNFSSNHAVVGTHPVTEPVALRPLTENRKIVINQQPTIEKIKVAYPKPALKQATLTSTVSTAIDEPIVTKPLEPVNESTILKLPIADVVKPAITLVKAKRIPIIHLNDMNYTLTVPVLADAKRKVMIFSLNESQQESTTTELQGDISINNHTPSTFRLIKTKPKPTIISFTENQ